MKVLITRPRTQAADFAERLRDAGFEAIFFPVIEIRPVENNIELDNAIKNIQKYDWVVFTSINAVGARLALALAGIQKQQIQGQPRRFSLRIAAVGPKTADALCKQDIEPDFIPDEYVADAILSGLGDLKGKWVLLPRADIARKELPEAIVKAGGIVHEVVVYQTLPAEINEEGLSALKSGVDFVTFTSTSTVENFVAIMRQNKLDPLDLPNSPISICIGPVTEKAAKEAGFQKIVVAKKYTTDGLVEEINKYSQTQMEEP